MLGDFDQNIYTWRGSNVGFINEYIKTKQHKIVYL